MSQIFWGVDSLFPANSTKNTPLKETPFEIVKKEERKPDFWGRYISGLPKHVLTAEEAKFLLNEGCRVLPIYKGQISEMSVKNASKDVGKSHAQEAIRHAGNLSIPRWTYIFANLEWNWIPTKDWFIGWWTEMFNSTYGGVGGFYCMPAGNNRTFLKNYEDAMNEVRNSNLIPNILNLCPIFSSGPSRGCTANRQSTKFEPFEPAFNPGSSQLWQYAIDCHKVGGFGVYDKVFANEKGFNKLWH